jgi:hypothetical protein
MLEKAEEQIQENISEKRNTPRYRKLPIQTLLIEVFSIVLGVLLALGMNEWREQRAHQSQVKAALQNISHELRSNLEVLTTIHQNNVVTVDAIAKSNEGGTDTTDDRTFIPGLQLRKTAWETLQSTGVSNYADYETMLQLSGTYSMQGVYTQTGVLLTEAAMNMSAFAVAHGKEVDNEKFSHQFYDYFAMLVRVEEELLKSYQKSIDHLEKR